MDLSDTIAPTSDQLDAVDLLAGPRVFTIERVDKGSVEQPVNIFLVEFPRPWRPGKSMRRVLVKCWGPDASPYAGRFVRLYCDPDVKFGGDKVGGTRISHLSHIDGPQTVPLLITRGKSAMYPVQPLVEADALREVWRASGPERRAEIEARVKALGAMPAPSPSAPPQEAEPAPSAPVEPAQDGFDDAAWLAGQQQPTSGRAARR